jgi:hypothetical protein
VKSWTNQYYIPWDNGRSTQAVIDQFDGQDKGLILAESALGGESWYSGHTLSVFNLQVFLEVDWDTLANSNRANVLTKEYGGYIHYVKAQEEKQRKLKAEVAEFTNKSKK